AVGQLRAEEAAPDRRDPPRGGQGRAPLAAVGEEVLRLPPVHPDQPGPGRPGPRAGRLDHPRPRLTPRTGCGPAPSARTRWTPGASRGAPSAVAASCG